MKEENKMMFAYEAKSLADMSDDELKLTQE